MSRRKRNHNPGNWKMENGKWQCGQSFAGRDRTARKQTPTTVGGNYSDFRVSSFYFPL